MSSQVVDVSCAVRDIRAPLRLLVAGWLYGSLATWGGRNALRAPNLFHAVFFYAIQERSSTATLPPRTARDFDRQMRVATRSVVTEWGRATSSPGMKHEGGESEQSAMRNENNAPGMGARQRCD